MILIAGPAKTRARPSGDHRGRRGVPHFRLLTQMRRSPRPLAETRTIPSPARGCTASSPFAPGNAANAGETSHNITATGTTQAQVVRRRTSSASTTRRQQSCEYCTCPRGCGTPDVATRTPAPNDPPTPHSCSTSRPRSLSGPIAPPPPTQESPRDRPRSTRTHRRRPARTRDHPRPADRRYPHRLAPSEGASHRARARAVSGQRCCCKPVRRGQTSVLRSIRPDEFRRSSVSDRLPRTRSDR